MQQSKDRIQNFILLIVDTVCIAASYFLAGVLWFGWYRGNTFARTMSELLDDRTRRVVHYGNAECCADVCVAPFAEGISA